MDHAIARALASGALTLACLAPGTLRADPAGAAPPNPTGALRLVDALAAALAASPEIEAQDHELRASESAVLQARFRPSPELQLEVDDWAGSGSYQGLGGSESTLRIGQLVELGGKRLARVRAAEGQRAVAAIDRELARLDVLVQTADAFVDLVEAQERVHLREAAAAQAAALLEAAERRERAGAGAPAEASRFRVEHATARVAGERAERDLAAARLRLAARWGASDAAFESARGDLAHTSAIPELGSLTQRIDTSPDLAWWSAELAARAGALELARSRALPDVRVGPGVRYYAEGDDAALVLGASVPLPIWDRNQGGIAEARHRLARADALRRASLLRVRAALADAHARARAAREEAEGLARSALPGAEAGEREVLAAYERGRLGALDVIEARRATLALREDRVRALAEHHRAVSQLERLLGAPLHDTPRLDTAPGTGAGGPR